MTTFGLSSSYSLFNLCQLPFSCLKGFLCLFMDSLDRFELKLQVMFRQESSKIPRPGNVHIDEFFDFPWSRRHDINLATQKDRFFKVVGNKEDCLARSIVNIKQVLMHHRLGQGVHRPVWFVHKEY